ncbi:MAG: hypothetical protein P8R00_04755 [Candidatus Poseidoniaceae archaeon]|nr:hypothetical protein [Candidatus Poseidoniaceae archaeon]
MQRVVAPLLVFCLFAVVSIAPLHAGAHTASSFTVLVKESGFSQSSPEIFHNDSIIWYNTDNASNLTHRLVHDHDGDGLFNGSLDWDSGELHAYCERDENNTKVDDSCNTSFVLQFDVNWTEGDYDYQDLRSDGSTVNATIRLFKDMDSHNASTAPSIGSSFGVNDDAPEDNTPTNEATTPEDVLLYIAMGTGGAAVLLLGLLVLRRPEHSDSSESE